MRQPVVIIGAGGHAREIADIIEACVLAGEPYDLLGYLDDDAARHGARLCGRTVLGSSDWLRARYASGDRVGVVLGLGAPKSKRAWVEAHANLDPHYPSIVHPRAEITRWIKLGEGVIIAAGCVLTNEIELGAHVHVNRLATVGHDAFVGRYTHLAPGSVVSGHVRIEEGCDIGTNACVIQQRSVGAWTIVGAGAAVIEDLPAHVTAVGVPARVVKRHPTVDPTASS